MELNPNTNIDANLVIDELLNQIAALNKDKAILAAMLKLKDAELKELQNENKNLKGEIIND
jgi:hypothetical protein